MPMRPWARELILLAALCAAAEAQAGPPPTLRIPRVSRPPKLQDFLEGTPREAEARVSEFRQYEPGDGMAVSRATAAYLSYDDKNLYVVFVCQDEPAQVRGHLAKREDIENDDQVIVNLDTFHDRRHAYNFISNPQGIQRDEIFTEGQGADASFDTLWYSQAQLTEEGYVVWMAIPFKSLRFPRLPVQDWGIGLGRSIRRNNELSTWPYITRRIESYLQQLATVEGVENISPGRNLQFIPYFVFRRARGIDPLAAGGPDFRSETEGRPGLDAKLVLRDALTLDVAINPDFSQVESDEPQVTVNQRFEVFFPEKRPFFIENAGYFQTPINLFFSRRIADPQAGVRLTGKIGHWTLGAIAIDDRAPGKLVPPSDPLRGERAGISVVRVQREFANQSTLGLLVTSRDFASSSNRVFALDTRLKFGSNWVLAGQAIRSYTRTLGGSRRSGPGYWASLSRKGRHLRYETSYTDFSPDFRSELGFVPRVDIRKMQHKVEYTWWREQRRLVSFGPEVTTTVNWNRQGQVQDWVVDAVFWADLRGPSWLACGRTEAYELFQGLGFRRHSTECSLGLRGKWLELSMDFGRGSNINYFPGAGLPPFLAQASNVTPGFTLRPSSRFRLSQTYLYTRLGRREGGSIFNNHILRTKVNYQFTRPLSLRVIFDYNGVLPNPSLVALERNKRLTGDVLLTYLLNPGTALYVGYTDTYENLRIGPAPPGPQRTASPELSTGRQFFVKLSYLFRF